MWDSCITVLIWRLRLLWFLIIGGWLWYYLFVFLGNTFHRAGVVVGAWLVVLSAVPTLILGYFMLVQPIQDGMRRKRGEPLFRLRCVLFGHKWREWEVKKGNEIHMTQACDRCGLVYIP